ncbi:bile acid:sodium symporter family protein [Catalinimonas niigatensis]|uniref:bile acid:sodium symporter family protein n=1 Tax=Catalinimonas niigatensis TaxID=1397264 RepID=UPI002666EE4F|nr:hypothetical protein [Catalinimonas niigatensis]WPP48184.1 hypothetical protein PZB72_16055 [Catalinimonas niigatensis]
MQDNTGVLDIYSYFRRMNDFAKKYFNPILFLSTVLGFILPQPGEFAGTLILAVLCVIIFASSFKVDFSPDFFRSQTKTIVGFYVLRFLLLPVFLFYLIQPFSPFYATALFLLCVLPCGVTSPAFSNVFNGNVTLALALLILSSSLTPLVLPYLGGLLMAEELKVNQFRLLTTLFITVVFPYLVHLPVRRHQRISRWMRNHDSFISIFGIAAIFALAIAEYRPILLSDTRQILPYFLVNLSVFLFLYFFGYSIWFKARKSEKVALLFSSGANNVALGVVISFLYFPTQTGVFFVVSEIVWVLVLIPVRKLMTKLVLR